MTEIIHIYPVCCTEYSFENIIAGHSNAESMPKVQKGGVLTKAL